MACSHEHKIVNETSNDDWSRDVGPTVAANVIRLTFGQDQTLLDLNDNV